MSNRLARESSPYLLQHAGNPVDWYPWGKEALDRARQEDKPLLVSIGYSACHWCHVMEHECFENESIAELMNKHFINIKVDREERPDLDHIYMQAVQAMTGGGGWPLTVFLTPQLKPFYGGTYFPPRDSQNLPAFPKVLLALADAYRNRRSQIEQTVAGMDRMFDMHALQPSAAAADLHEDLLHRAYSALEQSFDLREGGFNAAPKFPQPLTLEFLLRYYTRYRHVPALEMVELTLGKMAAGGIYDQIGGGFHRYATDEAWQYPHFEKMLYDNALLSGLYLHAFQVTGKSEYARIAEETLDYLLREMRSKEGGFYSSQDADSEGEEGRYYLWTPGEMEKVLRPAAAGAIAEYYGVNPRGNFNGRSILNRAKTQAVPAYLREAKLSLLAERETRIKPGRDEKVLADWNGLVLSSLAEAAGILKRPDYLAAARMTGEFLLTNMFSAGELKHTFISGRAGNAGYLSDYASLIEGLLALHKSTLEFQWLEAAGRLSGLLIERFLDNSSGLLFDTPSGLDDLIVRPRNTYDGVSPSGVSLACLVLLKLAALNGNEQFSALGRREISRIIPDLQRDPLGHSQWLCDLDFYLSSPGEIVLAGDRKNPQTQELSEMIGRAWLPHMNVAAFDPDGPEQFSAWPVFEGRKKINGQPAVYICRNNTCRAPVTNAADLAAALKQE